MLKEIKEYAEYAGLIAAIVGLFAVTVFLAIVAMAVAISAAQYVLRGIGIVAL
jgi:hypothetical protein